MVVYGYMNYSKHTMKNVLLVTLLLLPHITLGMTINYEPLVGVPGLSGSTDMNVFFNALYALSISIAALLAVIKVVVAGVKYMLSDVVTTKASAISDIQNALIGLIIVVGAWVILYVINPQIVGGFRTPPGAGTIQQTPGAAIDEPAICSNPDPQISVTPCGARGCAQILCQDVVEERVVANCPSLGAQARVFCVPTGAPPPSTGPTVRTIDCACANRSGNRCVSYDCTSAEQRCIGNGTDQFGGTIVEQTARRVSCEIP